jgi:hypothetical protein
MFDHYLTISSIDTDDGFIDRSEFYQAMGIDGDSFFMERMFGLFDEDGDNQINFREFVSGLAILASRASTEDKIKCALTGHRMRGGLLARERARARAPVQRLKQQLAA